MTSSSQTHSHAPSPVVWRSWPLRDEPAAAWLTAAVMVVLAVGVIVATGSGWLGLFAVLAIGLAMWRLFVPIEYHLGARGLRQTLFGRSRLIAWSQIRVVEVRRCGILVYPDAYFGPLRAMRGVYIPWGGNREEVLRVVEFYASTILVDHEPTTGAAQAGTKDDTPTLDDTAEHPPAPPLKEGSTERNIIIRS
ncbi:MAG: hypothetical protein WEA31_04515 [Pirellulales bacterium]